MGHGAREFLEEASSRDVIGRDPAIHATQQNASFKLLYGGAASMPGPIPA
jgi:hypothetical protein